MWQGSSSLDCTQEPDTRPSFGLNGWLLCQEVVSILHEGCYTGEEITSERLLNAVLRYASRLGYRVTYSGGKFTIYDTA